MRRPKQFFRAMVAKALAAFGYALIRPAYTRFGLSLSSDLRRICGEWNWQMDVVFDVGANCGQFAQEMIREWPDARVYSFEPSSTSHSILYQAAKQKPQWIAEKVALSDHVGFSTLHVYSEDGPGSMLNSLVPNAQYPTKFGLQPKETIIPTSTIDDYCLQKNIKEISFLKVDTEGSELEVLRGARAMLSESRVRFVYFEFNSLRHKEGASGGALIPIADYLESFGYEYLICYTDYVTQSGRLHVVANVLFAKPD